MMYSAIAVATIALSATRAAAFPGFESGGSFDFKGTAEGLSETDNGDSGDKSFSNTDTTTVGGFSACAAKSWAGAAAGSKDSYASAMAEVVAKVCDPYFTGDPAPVVDGAKKWASAYAQAGASAIGGCVAVSDFGTVKGCTYASSYASEAASALAEVHVLATSLAIAESCPSHCSKADSWSISSAEAVAKIMASAQADAEIEACAFDNQVSGAKAFADCYAKITAKTLALAVAASAAEAGCWTDESGADAATATLAAFKFQITEIEKCDIDSSEVGLADANSNGGATVGFEDVTSDFFGH